MIGELLLGAALEAGLGLIGEVGFGDEVRRTSNRWLRVDERVRRQAFDAAFDQAVQVAGDPTILSLLEHQPLRHQVWAGLLDPTTGLDVQSLSDRLGEQLPAQADAVSKFFAAFENALLDDPTWGPPLERFQQMRARQDVQQALALRHAAISAPELVQRVSAELTGDGAIGQDRSIVGGRQSIVARKIVDSVLATSGGRAIKTGVYVEQMVIADPEAVRRAAAGRRYLSRLRQRCNALPIAAMGGEEDAAEEVTLPQVYQELDTTTRVPSKQTAADASESDRMAAIGGREQDRPLSAMEAATSNRRLVLLGEAGSGKSTFVRQLAAGLATARLDEDAAREGWQDKPLPMLLSLRDLAPALNALNLEGLAEAVQVQRLVQAVHSRWLAQLDEYGAADFAPGLEEALDSGNALLLFDGLDEVPQRLRKQVRQAVRAVYQAFSLQNRVIVTCRIRSYVGPAKQHGFAEYTLAPFDELKIRRFTAAWYNAQVSLGRLDAPRAAAQADDFRQAAQSSELRQMAENPMLLTTMAIVHLAGTGLPKERVRLYKKAIDVLLTRWQRRKALPASEALESLLKDDRRLRRILERLAYDAHESQSKGNKAGELSREVLLRLLEGPDYLESVALADEFLDYIDQRAGLLVGHGGEEDAGRPSAYSIPHRAFQEYLAGCRMIEGRNARAEYRKRVKEGDYWRDAALYGAEELVYNRNSEATLMDLAYDLCPPAAPTAAHQWRAALWSGQMAALLGVDYVRRDAEQEAGDPEYLERLLARLVGVMCESPLTPIERAEAGRALARLGDPRPEVLTVEDMRFCFVPGGPFWMGEGREEHRNAMVAYDFWIARFPVTQAQYRQFVAAGGYTDSRWWPEAIQAQYWSSRGFQSRYDDAARTEPYRFGDPFDLANHPVVGVSWYEAVAFTHWLTHELHESHLLPQGWQITLPSEAEWEKAARGGLQIPARHVIRAWQEGLASEAQLAANPNPRRAFPWDGEANPQCANYNRSEIGATSAVGCFAAGVSPYGCEDLNGNVWEWCATKWLDSYEQYSQKADNTLDGTDVLRVLRGGSFDANEDLVRCAARYRYLPNHWFDDIGFRVVASP